MFALSHADGSHAPASPVAFLPPVPLPPAARAAAAASSARRPARRSRGHFKQVLTPSSCASTSLPSSYDDMRKEAVAAALEAVSAGEKLIELNFPPVPNMATAALNELLDANRSFAREFLFSCRPRFPPSTLHAVFPDASEARLAARYYGPDRPFLISALPTRDAPPFVADNPPGLVVVVSPGFNVSEWIAMEKLEGQLPVIAINADLDKVRGGYYPRLFYPGLHAVKDRFLSRFKETYYLKMFSNGGTLLRRLPDVWRLFYQQRDGEVVQVWEGEQRPDFRDVEKLLAQTRAEDLAESI